MAGTVRGVLLPIITPFVEGRVDIPTYRKLVAWYLEKGIHGLVPLGTTGESPTMEENEYHQVVEATVDVVKDTVPVYVGVSSNSTAKAIHHIRDLNRHDVTGFLVTSPANGCFPARVGIPPEKRPAVRIVRLEQAHADDSAAFQGTQPCAHQAHTGQERADPLSRAAAAHGFDLGCVQGNPGPPHCRRDVLGSRGGAEASIHWADLGRGRAQ
jgi:Dihydrodipicolinate synthetase family